MEVLSKDIEDLLEQAQEAWNKGDYEALKRLTHQIDARVSELYHAPPPLSQVEEVPR